MVTGEHFSLAEGNEDISHYSGWEQEAIHMAMNVLESEEDFISLPSKFEIHEYQIMENFCLSLDDEKLKGKIYGSIKGSGAFRRFKDCIFEYGIEKNWFQYRREALKRIAIDWCEGNGIPYTEE